MDGVPMVELVCFGSGYVESVVPVMEVNMSCVGVASRVEGGMGR